MSEKQREKPGRGRHDRPTGFQAVGLRMLSVPYDFTGSLGMPMPGLFVDCGELYLPRLGDVMAKNILSEPFAVNRETGFQAVGTERRPCHSERECCAHVLICPEIFPSHHG